MNRLLKKRLRILYERIKVPGKLIRLLLHLVGLYKRGFRNALNIQLTHYELFFQNLPEAFDGYTLLVATDFHIDSELHLVPRLRTLLGSVEADVLLLLGDYRYSLDGPYDRVLTRMQRVVQAAQVKEGIFAIRGNHDSKELMEHMAPLGMRVLDNASVTLTRNDQQMFIVGVDDPHYDQLDDLPRALTNIPKSAFKILMAHTSEIYKEAHSLGISLYLCGHTHGGQIDIKHIGPVITNVHAPRRFARGVWSYRGMQGFTSTGVGTSSVPVRFNCPPELVLLTLKKA
mgnify:CR=1 FL=1